MKSDSRSESVITGAVMAVPEMEIQSPLAIQDSGGAENDPVLVCRLLKTGDRFAHEVLVLVGGQSQRLLSSVEGDDQTDAPPSPPIQDLSVERRPEGDVALGVGMAGPSLWSFSVQAFPRQGRIRFDIACNHRQGPALPCSSYREADDLNGELLPSTTQPSSWSWPVGQQREWGLSLAVADFSEPPITIARVSDQQFSLRSDAMASPPKTYRWGYEITLSRI